MTEQLTTQQQLLQALLMLDTNDPHICKIPAYKTPEWVKKLGYDLKDLFNNKTFTKMYFNKLGIIEIE